MTQTLKGTVLDKAVKTPLLGATVRVLPPDGQPLGAVADADGRFRVAGVPVGKVAVQVSYLGYKSLSLPSVAVNSGKEVELVIELEEDLLAAHEVVVTAKVDKQKPLNELAAVSARTFSVDETQRFAAAVNDPARMAASFAGVVTGNDGNNTISIRGNSPNGMLWRIEGVDIPAPNHFSAVGSSGGGISLLSAQLLGNSDFMTGAFAAEYGNALSGVFDLRLRKGNSDRREHTFQAGVLGLDAALEGPLRVGRETGSYLVNYRYSTLSLLSKMGVNIGDATTNFQDLSFNVWLPAGRFGSFSLFGIGGLSDQRNPGKADSTTWKEDFFRRYPFDYVANTGAAGLTHTKGWDRSFLKTVVSVSATENGLRQDEFQPDYRTILQYDQRHLQRSYSLSSTLSHKFNARHYLRAGAYISVLDFDFRQRDWNWEDDVLEEKVRTQGHTQRLNAFAQWQYRASPRLTLNTGLHSLGLLLNGHFSVEPRASAQFAVTKHSTLSLGYGLHTQLQPLGIYFVRTAEGQMPNRDLDHSKAQHLVLAYDQSLGSHWRVKAEAYHQWLFDVPVQRDAASAYSLINEVEGFSTKTLDNQGIGENYGLELTVEKFLSRGFYLLLSSSLFESKYQGSDGIWRNTRFNTNYVNTLTAGKEWNWNRRHKNRTFGLNLKMTQLGGLRETPIDLAASRAQGNTVYDDTRAFELQLDEYFRLDLGMRLKRNYTHLTTTLGLDIQNATNRKNVFVQYYDPSTLSVKRAYQAPLLPILYYRVEF
ncbi:MAG TPA: TonB-dependent receptor [Saprospiraceae bacterium]|nr:TonB-dependent receptor [Saprospiraceae bacterium]